MEELKSRLDKSEENINKLENRSKEIELDENMDMLRCMQDATKRVEVQWKDNIKRDNILGFLELNLVIHPLVCPTIYKRDT